MKRIQVKGDVSYTCKVEKRCIKPHQTSLVIGQSRLGIASGCNRIFWAFNRSPNAIALSLATVGKMFIEPSHKMGRCTLGRLRRNLRVRIRRFQADGMISSSCCL
jgi:hypothetical protein